MEPESAQVREFIERLVEALVSGQLDDVKLNRLYTHPECEWHEYCVEMLDSCDIPMSVSWSLVGTSSAHVFLTPIFTELVLCPWLSTSVLQTVSLSSMTYHVDKMESVLVQSFTCHPETLLLWDRISL
jgi:hypothetical protein